MGAFQFAGFSFGTVGANGGGDRPLDAPPINSFIVWRGNKVHSNGGFSIASDVDMTPGAELREGHQSTGAQPFTSEVLLEANTVQDSAVPFARGSGATCGPRLLEQLGCEVMVLGGTPDGRFEHMPEPVEQNLGDLCRAVVEHGADAGFAQDPDADRLAIVHPPIVRPPIRPSVSSSDRLTPEPILRSVSSSLGLDSQERRRRVLL